MCIRDRYMGLEDTPIDIHFEMRSGHDGKYLDSHEDDKNITTATMLTERVESIVEDLRAQTKYLIEQEDHRVRVVESLSGKLMNSSIVTIVVVLVLAFLQVRYLKAFFRKKKLI
eukprot:TRINITY_DN5945_c0_g2_i2.p1 TRINITY_DN5945_c0_g2~~TRINITY_DN5945_c0_g2_i2.p1  ORF type:complete len:114 (+),score=49.43 TRINITY_DN5945_c0_g2_i2:65-406(+)